MKRIYLIAFICLILASCDTTNVPSVSTNEQKVSINLSWKGSLSSAPQNPKAGDMYYNTTQKKSFIYDGSSWQIIAQDGKDGSNGSNGSNGQNTVTNIDGYLILWQGSLNAAPSNPSAGWAYYDTIKRKSFIYDGTNWQILAQDGNDGNDGHDGQNGQNGQDGTSNTNANTSIKDTVYIGESTETIEGITYTVQSYADVYAANPYFYTYYKYYYLNDKLRRIYCYYHNFGSALDYPYTEFQEHYCSNNSSSVWIYYENGILESNTNYQNGQKNTENTYYESGNKKTMNYYQQGNVVYYTYTYYDNEYNTNKTYEIFLETNHQKTTFYENGKTEYQIQYNSDGTESSKSYYTYYENGKTEYQIQYNSDGTELSKNYYTYYENGTTKTYDNYRNSLIYQSVTYYENGKIEYNKSYKNGIINSSSLYNENEKLLQYSSYYDNGIINSSIFYFANNNSTNIQSKSLYYYEDGTLHQEGYNYEDGSTKFIAQYNNDTTINYFRYNYISGYIKYYYSNNYYYTFNDNKTGKGGTISLNAGVYSTKTAFTEEEALAKLEELRNE